MISIFKRILVLCLFLSMLGCTPSKEEQVTHIFAMDTYMTIKVYDNDDSSLKEIEDMIQDLEKTISVTNSHSEIAQLNQKKSLTVSNDTSYLLNEGLKICEETDGALDLSIYPVLKLWGFTTKDYKIPTQKEITSLLPYVNYKDIKVSNQNISIGNNMEVDLGSITKGYTGDKISQYLKENGIDSAILDLGGNIHTVGKKSNGNLWKIGIKNPSGEGQLGVIEVEDKAVITSGGYERYFIKDNHTYWHILDPHTGYPSENGIISMTVIGENGLRCDGLSTALFVMGKEKAIQYYQSHKDFDMIFIDHQTLYKTPGISFTPDESLEYDIKDIEDVEE